MNTNNLQWKINFICEQLTTEQIIESRQWRNWSKYDKLDHFKKLMIRLEELEMFSDIIDPHYKLKVDYE